jgi:hypothetical protein
MSAVNKMQADGMRKRGLQECLIQVKDKHYYENHVEPHLSSFLRFFVKGAVAYYKNKGSIDIPQTMQITAQQETRGDVEDTLMDFVRAKLVPTLPALGNKLLTSEIEKAFKESAEDLVNVTSLDTAVFGKHLKKAIDKMRKEHGGPWTEVYKDQRHVGREKPTFYINVAWRPAELPAEKRYAARSQQ